MQDFIIVTPQYTHNSNGIKALHKICHTVNNLGGRAKLAFIDSASDPNCTDVSLRDNSWTNPALNTPTLQESERHLFDTAYVLYPEIMIGNPFNAKKIIRYFGNREGYCNGKMIGIGPNDFLLAHSRLTRPDAHYVLFNSEINPVFHGEGTRSPLQRTLNTTYIGKGHMYAPAGVVNKTLHIRREWPEGQEELALLLREVRCFYTWDSWSQINVEAVLCGAVPFFLLDKPWTDEDIDGSEIGHIPRIDGRKRVFDPVAFDNERTALIQRINALTTSWDSRAHEFMKKTEAHFETRGI